MLEYYFNDLGALRDFIRILNEHIELYGCVDLDFVKRLIELDHCPKYTDVLFGWTEIFVESRDVVPVLIGGYWQFKFTLPGSKGL